MTVTRHETDKTKHPQSTGVNVTRATTAPAHTPFPRFTAIEQSELDRAKGRRIDIAWMDARRPNSSFIFIKYDNYNLLVEAQDGRRILVPKHAVSFIVLPGQEA